MIRKMRKKAYAKINLFLEVGEKRPDGYHEIDTLMQTVQLYDRLTVTVDSQGAGIFVSCNKSYIPTDRSNIVYRCVEEFLKEQRLSLGVTVDIEKRIPVAAGLGGGSADGAAVLLALNRLTGAKLSEEKLCQIGRRIGADIPFCIKGGAARARGVGEVLSEAPRLPDTLIPVIAIGSKGSSTPAAYRALDEMGYRGSRRAEELMECLEKGERIQNKLYNAFERAVFPENREAEMLKRTFGDLGAEEALLSGSGAAVFGLFSSEKKAKEACAYLRKHKYFAVVARQTGRRKERT